MTHIHRKIMITLTMNLMNHNFFHIDNNVLTLAVGFERYLSFKTDFSLQN